MSLAYALGKDGKLQVAYEAMDKISIFKNGNWWVGWCPCCQVGREALTNETIVTWKDNHLTRCHSDDD